MNHSRRWSIDSARRDATLSALQALRAAGQFTRLEVAHWLPDSPAPAPDAEAGWTLVLEVSDDGVLESECAVPDGAEVALRRRGARRAEVVAWTTVVSGTTPPGALSADVDDLGVWVGVDGVSRVGRVSISAESLAGIEPRTGLHVLSLKDCAGITDLRPLAGLTALHTLTCWGCDYLSDIRPLRGLTALRDLDLSFADDVDDLTPLSEHFALRSLNLEYCLIRTLEPLERLTELEVLSLSHCYAFRDVDSLIPLTGLRELNLHGTGGLRDVEMLAGLTELTTLNLAECGYLRDLTPLRGLTKLRSLNVYFGPKPAALRALRGMAGLVVSRERPAPASAPCSTGLCGVRG